MVLTVVAMLVTVVHDIHAVAASVVVDASSSDYDCTWRVKVVAAGIDVVGGVVAVVVDDDCVGHNWLSYSNIDLFLDKPSYYQVQCVYIERIVLLSY